MVFSVIFAASAFAYPVREVVYYGNSQNGSVSYGNHGHSWYSDSADLKAPVLVKGVFDQNTNYEGKKRYHNYNPASNYFNYNQDRYFDYDEDGQWEFYIDAKGVRHYFYVDPDREGEWHMYKDNNGVTQYYYEVKGWK